LRDPFVLPAKRSLTTNLVPSAWLDDELIAERKEGLSIYLDNLLQCYDLQDHPLLVQFLTPGLFYPFGTPQTEPGDPVANMRSKSSSLSVTVSPGLPRESYIQSDAGTGHARDSEPLAAAYYPSWSADTLSPEKIAYAKFDIIFFCK
jgi:chitinase